MQETEHGAQAKIDRAIAKLGATPGKPGSVLPPGAAGQALFYNATSGKWEPGAVPGSGAAASKVDPLGFGIPWSFDPILATVQAQVGGVNKAHFYRVQGGGTITKIGFRVSVASGNVCLGVYANTGTGRSAAPGARLATTGLIPCPASGYAEVSLGASIDISSGDHWFAIAADNVTATFDAVSTSTSSTQGRVAWQDSAIPLPSTATASNGGGNGGGGRGFLLLGIA